MMLDAMQRALLLWAHIMGIAEGAVTLPAYAPALVLLAGAVLCFLGCRTFRAFVAALAFFASTALLMWWLRPLLPFDAVVTFVAVLGVMLAFVSLFVKRASASCLCMAAAGFASFAYAGVWWAGLVGAAAGLLASLMRPKETLVGITAFCGAALMVDVIWSAGHAHGGVPAGAFDGAALRAAAMAALVVAGALVQRIAARRVDQNVFTQVITLHAEDGPAHEPHKSSAAAAANTAPATDGAAANATCSTRSAPIAAGTATAGASAAAAGSAAVATGAGAAAAGTAAATSASATLAAADGERLTAYRAEPERRVPGIDAMLKEEAGTRPSSLAPRSADPAETTPRGAGGAGGAATAAATAAAATAATATALPLEIERAAAFEPHFRHEIKYRITIADFLHIRSALDAYFTFDPYSGADGYPVRSLYFDSLDDRDLYDKLDGVFEHKKIRLRAYSPHGPRYNLEYKCRWEGDGIKRKLSLDRSQAERLIDGDYAVLLEFDPDPLARELFERMVRGCYRPKVVVEYQRIAYLYPASNIRVTWDRGITASYFPQQFFSERLNGVTIVPPNLGVLEVKYDQFFPSVLRGALNSLDRTASANSKYALARLYL